MRPVPSTKPRVLLIGASTGGPPALNAVLGAIGRVIDHAPVLITQHMPSTFTTILAEHLSRASGRTAAEAWDGVFYPQEPNHFGSRHPGGVGFVFVDGHVSFLGPRVDYNTYKALSTRAGGEAITGEY